MTKFYMNLDIKLTYIWVIGGNLRGGVNREGITYYNNLINELLSNGLIQSLFHT